MHCWTWQDENPHSSKQDLGFVLGPRINAAGRMETMDIGIECLLATDMQSAYALARQLNALNQERRQVEGQIKQDALAELEKLQLDQSDLHRMR